MTRRAGLHAGHGVLSCGHRTATKVSRGKRPFQKGRTAWCPVCDDVRRVKQYVDDAPRRSAPDDQLEFDLDQPPF